MSDDRGAKTIKYDIQGIKPEKIRLFTQDLRPVLNKTRTDPFF